MNLEERYNTASPATYVGKVRTTQADGTTGDGVNFFDGRPRGLTPAPDEVQKEFTKNTAGDFRYDAGGKVPGKYTLSRWLPVGVNKGDTYFTNNAFTQIANVRNGPGTIVHKFSPSATFDESSVLSSFAKNRINSIGPAGPTPA